MAFRTLVLIDGERHDISGQELIRESVCDRCGRYMGAKTTVQVAAVLLGDMPHDVLIELCRECVEEAFPGLVDVAAKVAGGV